MLATKINLSQIVDLAVGTPEVGAVNCNALHTLLHAMLRQLNIADVQADTGKRTPVQDCGNLQQPTEKVVIEMSSQTDPVVSYILYQ